MKYRYAIYCGRFQPIHHGHLASLIESLKYVEKVCLGIRNVEVSFRNPLSPQEVKECWIRVLKRLGLYDYVIIKIIPDFPKNVPLPTDDKVIYRGHLLIDWARKVEEIFGTSPKYDVFVGNKPHMVLAFNLLGYTVISGHRSIHKLVDVSASKIRELILKKDEKWKQLLPKEVVEYLEEINIYERLKKL